MDACNNNLDDGFSRLVWDGNLAKIIVIVKLFLTTLVLFFSYYDPIQWYSYHHHSSLSAIDTLLPPVSFKPTFIDFAHLFNMLALSAVLILFIVLVCLWCVVCCSFVCFPFQFLYGWCLCRLKYCVCVKFIDAFRVLTW